MFCIFRAKYYSLIKIRRVHTVNFTIQTDQTCVRQALDMHYKWIYFVFEVVLKSEKNRQHAQSLDGGDDNNDDTSTVIYFVVTWLHLQTKVFEDVPQCYDS